MGSVAILHHPVLTLLSATGAAVVPVRLTLRLAAAHRLRSDGARPAWIERECR